jgi:hypothetical protein
MFENNMLRIEFQNKKCLNVKIYLFLDNLFAFMFFFFNILNPYEISQTKFINKNLFI